MSITREAAQAGIDVWSSVQRLAEAGTPSGGIASIAEDNARALREPPVVENGPSNMTDEERQTAVDVWEMVGALIRARTPTEGMAYIARSNAEALSASLDQAELETESPAP